MRAKLVVDKPRPDVKVRMTLAQAHLLVGALKALCPREMLLYGKRWEAGNIAFDFCEAVLAAEAEYKSSSRDGAAS